uniref:putative T7SS-secreted protein n=1 Tax=Microbacterium sp. TaxID=51671 RepID=UPI0032221B10
MRPSDWSAAGFGHDPVPGDPDQVRRGGQSYLEIAGTIRRTATGLRTLELDGTVSEAIDALATTASTVADDISRAEARYRATGNALVSYATQLAVAQDDSLTALRRAQAAQGAAEDAQNDRRRYLRLADSAADPTETLRLERLADAAGADGRHA